MAQADEQQVGNFNKPDPTVIFRILLTYTSYF